MKTKYIIVGTCVCTALAFCGCKKEEAATETQPPKAAESVTPAPTAPPVAQTVTQAAVNAAETVTTATAPVANVTNTPAAPVPAAQPQVQAAEGQAQGIIDQAKSLVADKKYQEALTSLAGLKNLQLTADQQKLVDSLKTQIQAALAKSATGDAASAVGNVLGEKK